MNSSPNQPRLRPRFTIRAVLMVTLLVALLLGWYSSVQNTSNRLTKQAHQLRYAEEELERARGQLEERGRGQVTLDGAHLRGGTIAIPGNAFQGASFADCRLENANLQGGTSAFQFARFDNSNLVDAKLTGGSASFQEATFLGADLTGAVLTGGGASFQGSSFENATLVRARLVGSFQLVNISGARFEGADLSALESQSLASCYFREAPTYDGKTKFPDAFDPDEQLWRRVAE